MYLGIDWGGTYIKAGIVDDKGNIKEKSVFLSGAFKKKEVFMNKISSLVKAAASRNIQAVGIGAAGIVNINKGFIYCLTNIKGWKNFPLKSRLEKKVKLPVFVNNDANLFALAEALCGQGKGIKRSIFLTLGTGLGGAVIIDGKILEGETSAQELGHMPISLEGRECSCGGKGCIETYVGNKYLLERYRKLKKYKTKVSEVKEIFKNAQRGEKEALIVWQESSRALGLFLSGLINVFAPQKIIFGGGVSGAFSLFKPLLEKEIRKQAMWPQVKGVKLVKAKLDEPGIIGAALYARGRVLH